MPPVSVIVPCFNEQSTIVALLEAVYHQDYPRQQLEVVIADGLSTDRTRFEIAEFSKMHPDLKVTVIENPRRIIPVALNLAIASAAGETILRLDGHSIPAPDYVRKCVENLEAGRGDNVGGCWDIRARDTGWQSRSIARAAAHPLGVGDARYRIGGSAQKVDTVPFGAYRKEFIERLGKYDETLLTNEDYELNVRIRKNGGVVWFDPDIRSTYLAAGSFKALMRQYSRYGYWKAVMLRKHPETIRWRQALPPLFVLSLLGLFVLGFFSQFFWLLLGIELLLYAVVLLVVGIQSAFNGRDASYGVGVPLAIMLMHVCWGASFFYGILASTRFRQ